MIVLGHRGGRGPGWPAENSLEAFERALEEGADGVELDVRLCASGEPVVFHDVSFARMTHDEDRRLVHAVSLRDLPKLDGGLDIPQLEETLERLRGRIVNVEVKSDVPSRLALVRAVARAVGRTTGVEIIVSSFDPVVVLACSVLAPRTPRALLIGGARLASLATMLPLALWPAIEAVHLDAATITAARVRRLHSAGLRVVAWTVNDARRANELATMGVDWLISDEPGAMRSSVQA